VAFLSDQGVKGLQPRSAYSAFGVVADMSLSIDVGTGVGNIPIGLLADIKAASAADKAGAIVTVEPEEGRLWVVLGASIYVLSAFPLADIHAWSEYTPGFTITATAVNARRLYVRAADTIYLYGGDDNATYDTTTAEVIIPSVTLEAPATFKGFHAIDIGVEGTWDVYVRPDPSSPDNEELVATGVTGQTFDEPTIAVAANTTHISLRLIHSAAEPATLSAVALHYALDTARG